MIKAFIFDMDGVIIDSEPLYFIVDKMVMIEFGVELLDEELNQYVGADNPQMWSELREKYELDISVQALIQKQDIHKEELLEKEILETIRGIDELILDLKNRGISIALASSSSMKFIDLIIERLRIKDCFDVIVSGEDVKNGKPAPDIFLITAELLNVKPEDCIVLEDSSNGVKAAKSAGMKCIAYRNPNSGDQDLSKADKIVDTLENLDYFINPCHSE